MRNGTCITVASKPMWYEKQNLNNNIKPWDDFLKGEIGIKEEFAI